MASVITIAGEQLFAAKAQANEQLDIDTFIFANVPNQDPNAPINREEGIPTAHIVYQQNVQQVGRINDNVVVYSTVLDSITGPFEFNWVGLYSSVNQKLVAINHVPTVTKTATAPGAAGNTLNRNFGIEYSGIADLTGITVDAGTWQLDFTARLSGMDLLTQQLAADMNGKDWFIDDGLKVVPRATVNTFSVTPGVGYVSGLRVELKQEHILIVQSYPQFVYVDAWFSGNANSTWSPQLAFTVTNTEMDDYIDPSGTQHYVYKLAVINSADNVDDLRIDNKIADKSWVESKAKITAYETSTPRELPDRFAHEIDVRDFGASDIALNNAAQFQAAFDKARELGKPVKAKGKFKLKDFDLKIYSDADFSGAEFIIDNVSFNILDSRDESDFLKVLNESELSKSLMTEGRGSLRGVVDDSLLDSFEDSFIYVKSDTNHQYRINNGDVSEYKQGSVSVLRRHGQLDYTLTHDYTESVNVRIELRKLPKNKIEIKCPKISVIKFSDKGLWVCKRALTNLVNPSLMTKQSDMIISDSYQSIVSLINCAIIDVDGLDTVGIGEPSGIEGVGPVVRYDLIYSGVVGLTIKNPNCGTGWKSIDGNYSRGILINGGCVSGIHGHFGVADVTIENTTITGTSISFATGANDSTINLKNIKYLGNTPNLFSLRSDFSELRGRVIIDGVDINTSKVSGDTFTLIDFYEAAVKNSGGSNPNQPRTLFTPRNIECKNVKIQHNGNLNLLNLPYFDYGADKKLKLSKKISFINIDVEDVSGITEFNFYSKPFDKDYSEPIIFEIKNFIQKRKLQPIILSIGKLGDVLGMPYDIRIENVELSTNFYNEKIGYIGGNYSSRLIVKESRIYRGFDMYDGTLGSGKLMYLEIDSCTYNPLDIVGESSLSLGSGVATSKIVKTTFNGNDFLKNVGRKPLISVQVNEQSNNTFIDYDVSDVIKNNNQFGYVTAYGAMYLLGSAVGHVGNYTKNESGTLLPTWNTNRDIIMIGRHWIWFDDSDNMRVHNNYPNDINNDGRVVGFK